MVATSVTTVEYAYVPESDPDRRYSRGTKSEKPR